MIHITQMTYTEESHSHMLITLIPPLLVLWLTSLVVHITLTHFSCKQVIIVTLFISVGTMVTIILGEAGIGSLPLKIYLKPMQEVLLLEVMLREH